MTIKAIQTRYKGYHFRSRLEARWAVFFDALGLEWEYEPEGFELPDGTRYLPDFRVKGVDGRVQWYEVKPTGDGDDPKMAAFAQSRKPLIRVTGPSLDLRVFHPRFGEGSIIDIEGDGPHARVQVNFDEPGKKWLVLAYANLTTEDGSRFVPPRAMEGFATLRGDPVSHFVERQGVKDQAIRRAAAAARSARFEFGQSGATA